MIQSEILNDNWTLRDDAGHKHHIRAVAEMIEKCEPPFVIGVHGDWGSGKTSFLRKLHLYFSGISCGYKDAEDAYLQLWEKTPEDHPDIETVWFDAWNYQFESNPIVALLNEIRAQFTLTRQFLKKAEKLAYAALMSLDDLAKKIGASPDKIVKAGEKWEKEHFSQPLPSQMLTDLLEKAIDDLLGNEKRAENNKKRLLIFVDDLDRCTGPVAFRFLEALKIYLSLSNCVFVLGIDVRHIRRAVAAELKAAGVIPEPVRESEGDRSEVYASDYLSKMFQHVFYLPNVTDYKKYLDYLMARSGLGEKEEWTRMITEYRILPPNARKIKSFISSLSIYVQQLNRAIEKYNAEKKPEEPWQTDKELALILTYLRLMANDIYRVLEMERNFWERLKEYCRSGEYKDHWALKNFILPEEYTQDPQSETGGKYTSTYPDPSDEGMFRAARLIREFRGGSSPEEDEHDIYLLRSL